MSEGEEPEFVLQLHYLGTVHWDLFLIENLRCQAVVS
jgi:hypothetical protein